MVVVQGNGRNGDGESGAQRAHDVEMALGARVIRHGVNGYQVQRLGATGKVLSVYPGSALMYRMFRMLCAGEVAWPVADVESGDRDSDRDGRGASGGE